jgi:site-specific DNA-methyltransferase (adenine-specific)
MDISNKITIGNAIDLTKALIPKQSIDFIITDPVYNQIEDYEWLAREAKRILKPDSSVIAFCSDIKMFECKWIMEKHLRFVKPLYYVVKAKQFSALRGYNIMTWTTPVLWFTNGKGWPHTRTLDTIITGSPAQGNHKWNKNSEAYARWIKDFTHPNDVIFDPFCGSGTVQKICKQTGRNFIAFEIDEKTRLQAQKEVDKVIGRQLEINLQVQQQNFL